MDVLLGRRHVIVKVLDVWILANLPTKSPGELPVAVSRVRFLDLSWYGVCAKYVCPCPVSE